MPVRRGHASLPTQQTSCAAIDLSRMELLEVAPLGAVLDVQTYSRGVIRITRTEVA